MVRHPEYYKQFLSTNKFPIFLFHGVVTSYQERVRNYNRKHIESEYFRDVLSCLLRAGGNPISMDDILAARHRQISLPERAFAITFDDGFENNLSVAAPILYDLSVPATIYVTTKFVEENLMSWVDRIEFAISTTSRRELVLPWSKVFSITNVESKVRVLEEVRSYVKTSPGTNPNQIADYIQDRLDTPRVYSLDDQFNLKLNWDQVRELSSNELISIGGHTHTHQILSHLDEGSLNYEISESIKTINVQLGINVRHFSYPEGLSHHFTERCIEVLKAKGVLICPSAIHGVNDIETDLFFLNRIQVI